MKDRVVRRHNVAGFVWALWLGGGSAWGQPLSSQTLARNLEQVGTRTVFLQSEPTINEVGAVLVNAGSFMLWRPTVASPNQLFTALGTFIPGGEYSTGEWATLDSSNRLLSGDGGSQPPGPTTQGVVFGPSGGLTFLARRRQFAPGLPSVEWTGRYGRPVASNSGQVYFQAETFSGTGIWTSNNGATPTLLFGGQSPTGGSAAPGLPGRTLTEVGPDVRITSSGTLAWQGFVSSTVGTRSTIFIGSSTTFQPVGLPGTAIGSQFTSSSFQQRMNEAGEMVFGATLHPTSALTGTGTPGLARRSTSGTVSLIARSGQTVPGVAAGTWNLAGAHALTNAGEVVFGGVVRRAGFEDDAGLWRADPSGTLSLAARNGTPVTGNAGLQLWTLDAANFVANAAGDVVFTSSVIGAGINTANDRGIFVHNPAFGVRQIAREGDVVEISTGVFWTIESLSFLSNTLQPLGQATSLNDARQFVYLARFTNGEFALRYTLIPAPGAASVFAGAVGWFGRRRRPLVRRGSWH